MGVAHTALHDRQLSRAIMRQLRSVPGASLAFHSWRRGPCRKMNEALCEVVEEHALVTFETLQVEVCARLLQHAAACSSLCPLRCPLPVSALSPVRCGVLALCCALSLVRCGMLYPVYDPLCGAGQREHDAVAQSDR